MRQGKFISSEMDPLPFAEDAIPLVPDSIPGAASGFEDIDNLYELLTDDILVSPTEGAADNVGLCLECHDDEVIHLEDSYSFETASKSSSPSKSNSMPRTVNIDTDRSHGYRLSFPDQGPSPGEKQSRVSCDECPKTFTRETLLLDHKALVHQIKDQYWCIYCAYKGQTYRNFHKHMKRQHPDKNVTFDHILCHKTVTTPKSIDTVSAIPNTTGQTESATLAVDDSPSKSLDEYFTCPECSKRFYRKKSLLDHKRTHVKDGSHKCTIPDCLKIFKTSSALNEHKMTVHATKAYKCPHDGCTKAYAIKRDLLYHQQGHGHKFKCSYPGCDKRFRDQHNLIVHVKSHLARKDQKCNYCDYVCIQKSSLNWHIKKKHHKS